MRRQRHDHTDDIRDSGGPRIVDLAREVAATVVASPWRSIAMSSGIVLGVAGFVAVLGLSTTVSSQVSDEFDQYRATTVRVTPLVPVGIDWPEENALASLRRLNGVVHAGTIGSLGPVTIDPMLSDSRGLRTQLVAADADALAAIEPTIVVGRTFDSGHVLRQSNVVMLSQTVASRLGNVAPPAAVLIDGIAYTVLGIYSDVRRQPEALLAGIVPIGIHDHGDISDVAVIVEVQPGASALIAVQGPVALSPSDSTLLQSATAPDPQHFRRSVESDIQTTALLISGVALLVGILSIAMASTAAIARRSQEIGLRRALGARPSHIFSQLLGESSLVGFLGSAAGAAVGVAIVVVFSAFNGWQPVLDLRLAIAAALAGSAIGLLSGLVPAARAIMISPVDALRS